MSETPRPTVFAPRTVDLTRDGRPMLLEELQPPVDALADCTARLWLGAEYLGEFPCPQVGRTYQVSNWLGEEDGKYLEVTLPDGRNYEVMATGWTMARGDWSHMKRAEPKKKRAKKAKAEEPAGCPAAPEPERQLSLGAL